MLAATDVITQAEDIGRNLQDLHRHHTLLTVSLPASTETFTSAILEVDLKKQYLLLDELFPRQGHDLVTREIRLGVGARLSGAPVSFEGVVADIGTDSDVAFYTLPFPDSISCGEQRSDYRVRVAFAYDIPIYIWADINNPFRGKLYDLSARGLGMRLGHDAGPTFTPGKADFNCIIQFPDGESVRAQLEICAVSPRKRQPHIKVGGRFVHLSKKDQRIIDQFVASSDRAQVKKLRR